MTFHFDAESHVYTDADGVVLPHVTELLKRAGLVDEMWYTPESCERGKHVHTLTADYDLGAIENPNACTSEFKNYLLGYVAASKALQPTWEHVEMPMAHSVYRVGCRPDRVGTARKLRTILEVKSGAFTKAHPIQTALQAIVAADDGLLPAEYYQRLGLYLRPNGKFKVEVFTNRGDFYEAHRILRTYGGASVAA